MESIQIPCTYASGYIALGISLLGMITMYFVGGFGKVAERESRSITVGDEGKAGYIAAIWSRPALGILYTLILEPETPSPKVVIVDRKVIPWTNLETGVRITIHSGKVVVHKLGTLPESVRWELEEDEAGITHLK